MKSNCYYIPPRAENPNLTRFNSSQKLPVQDVVAEITYNGSIPKENRDIILKLINDKNWEELIKQHPLSEVFLEDNKDDLDWNLISQFQILSEAFIEMHADLLNWQLIARYQDVSSAFIFKHRDRINQAITMSNSKFKLETLEAGLNPIPIVSEVINSRELELMIVNNQWWSLSGDNSLSEDFLFVYANYIVWPRLSRIVLRKLGSTFIENFKDRVDIPKLFEVNPNLPSELIRPHINTINWPYMFGIWQDKNENLNNLSFEFSDAINWKKVSEVMFLRVSFLKLHMSQLDWTRVIMHNGYDLYNFLTEHIDMIDFCRILDHVNTIGKAGFSKREIDLIVLYAAKQSNS